MFHLKNLSAGSSKAPVTLLYCKSLIKSTQKFGFFQLLQYNNKKSRKIINFVKNVKIELLLHFYHEVKTREVIDIWNVLCDNVPVKI